MNVRLVFRLGLLLLVFLGPGNPARGEDVTTSDPVDPMEGAAAAPATVPSTTVKWGADIYLGLSTLPGHRRYSDALWAGTRPWSPSTTFLSWENAQGYSGKVAIGLGESFNGRTAFYDQPAEAWLRIPLGPVNLTGGKYWTPFAGMEWHYETKSGLMLEWEDRRHTVSVSLNPNSQTDRLNTYTRIGRNIGEESSIGLSLGTGKGFSYGSQHALGWGLDASYTWREWTLRGEHLRFDDDRSERFTFSYLHLSHAGPGRLTPFLGWYAWHDRGRDFGTFESLVPGVQYQINATVSLEAAWATTSERKLGWLQLHYTYE